MQRYSRDRDRDDEGAGEERHSQARTDDRFSQGGYRDQRGGYGGRREFGSERNDEDRGDWSRQLGSAWQPGGRAMPDQRNWQSGGSEYGGYGPRYGSSYSGGAMQGSGYGAYGGAGYGGYGSGGYGGGGHGYGNERGDDRFGRQGYGQQDWGQQDWRRQDWRQQSEQEGGREEHRFDPDYQQWREEQIRNLDSDYRRYRQERYKKFSDEFGAWRKNRESMSGQSSGQSSGTSTGQESGEKDSSVTTRDSLGASRSTR